MGFFMNIRESHSVTIALVPVFVWLLVLPGFQPNAVRGLMETGSQQTSEQEILSGTPDNQQAGELPGRFGLGWNGAAAGFFHAAEERLGEAPLTVELWFKCLPENHPEKGSDPKSLRRLRDLASDPDGSGVPEHVFVSNGLQTSGDHWAIGARRESGNLFCHFTACRPATFETEISVADGKWHYVAATWDGKRVKLFLDDRNVVDEPVELSGAPVQAAALSLGTRLDEKRLTALVLDEVRLTDRCRDIVATPELPLTRDAGTLHLWDFEESRADYLAQWTPGGETNQRHLPYPHQIAEYELEGEEDWEDGRWQETIKGPVVSHTFLVDGHEMGAKLSAVFLDQRTTLVFDERACSFTAALTDSQMEINPARAGLLCKPSLDGQVVCHVSPRKTWLRKGNDQRWVPCETGQLDYRRMYLHDGEVLFEYRVGPSLVREHATSQLVGERQTILRRWNLDAVKESLLLTLAEGIDGVEVAPDGSIRGSRNGTGLVWSLGRDTSGSVGLVQRGRDIVLEFQPDLEPVSVALAITVGIGAEVGPDSVEEAWQSLPELVALMEPGGLRWGQPLETVGELAVDDGKAPYLKDELTVPLENPFQALMFISGVDFFANGDAAVCTAHGDVWKVSGIDVGLQQLRWQRFATGLYQPLGLKIVDGHVVVICRNQLTRLEDLNCNGEADIYHSLCHELSTQGGDHAYAMRLESDRMGNLYFLKSSEGPPHGCSLLRWNRESGHLEVIASGFRHPYGLGIGPNDELTVADNEGQFIPSSKIDLIEPGGFYGYFENEAQATDDARPLRPLCFIPKFIDNSCGGQIWVPDQRWGSYQAGEMLHLSWGRCTLHAVLRQQVGTTWQAATVRFPGLVFRSGSGTARFHPRDGQLYVVGLDGWQTGAVQDGCFSRVRHTGRTPVMPEAFNAFPNGICVRYTVPLDPELNLDRSRFTVEHWNYLWSKEYGSFHYRPSSPREIGHDQLSVERVSLLDDRTLFLHMKDLQPVDQIQLTANIVTAGGERVTHELLGTINALPEPLEVVADEARPADLFAMENLVAWCVVPFDAAKRGPVARAEMLSGLGFKRLAYDWRDEHLPTWDAEVAALREHKIDLTAFWAPVQTADPLNELHWRQILPLIDRHQLKMQLWVMLDEGLWTDVATSQRADRAAEILAPLAQALAERGCQLGIYNHGGWCGEPENMVGIVKALKVLGYSNTGIVYNLHHGHDQLADFPVHLDRLRDHLLCLNLNGMRAGGPQILPLGSGDDDRAILQTIEQSGYQGLIGILDHREELDAAESLRQNLDGLQRIRR